MRKPVLAALSIAVLCIAMNSIRSYAQSLAINAEPTPSVSAPPPQSTPSGSPGLAALRYAECPFCHKQYLATSTGRFVDHDFVTMPLSSTKQYVSCVTAIVNALRRISDGRIEEIQR